MISYVENYFLKTRMFKNKEYVQHLRHVCRKVLTLAFQPQYLHHTY